MYGADTKNTDLKGYVLFALARKAAKASIRSLHVPGLRIWSEWCHRESCRTSNLSSRSACGVSILKAHAFKFLMWVEISVLS